MRFKKGQVTIFIIIAIVLIGTILVFFTFKGNLKLMLLNPEIKEIHSFVQTCIEDVGGEIIYDIGGGGGYFFPPEFSTFSGIPYYYSNGESYMPSKKQIEEEISFFVSKKLFFCTRNFVDFPDFEISQREIKTKTIIKNDKVILNVEYPISITKEDSTTIIKDFKNTEIPVRLGIVYDSIEEIIQEQLNHKGICLSCILDIVLKNDLYVNMVDYDEETVVFIIRDENSKINNESFRFAFANKYEVKQ